jgi:hypothetical protein
MLLCSFKSLPSHQRIRHMANFNLVVVEEMETPEIENCLGQAGPQVMDHYPDTAIRSPIPQGRVENHHMRLCKIYLCDVSSFMRREKIGRRLRLVSRQLNAAAISIPVKNFPRRKFHSLEISVIEPGGYL